MFATRDEGEIVNEVRFQSLKGGIYEKFIQPASARSH